MNRKQKQAKQRRYITRQQIKQSYGDLAVHQREYIRTFQSPYLSKSERRELFHKQKVFGRFADPEEKYAALPIIGQFYMNQDPYAKRW